MADGRADVVGREAELNAIDDFLNAAPEEFAALLIEGDAGIGKTTLWREGLARAEARGFRILACRPAEAESSLSYAALGDLLSGLADGAFGELPDPQRRAIDVALLRVERGRSKTDPRAVGTALTAIVSRVAEGRPVLVAVDDVQWLDAPSAAALRFAARRLVGRPVRLLLSQRTDADGRIGDELIESVAERPARLPLAGVSVASLHHIISRRLGQTVSRPVLVQIAETSRGNPLYAVELARATLEYRDRAPGEPIRLPETLLELVRRRLDALPAATRECALCVAAAGSPTPALVKGVLGKKGDAALAAAERAGVIEERGGRLTFTHPLLASAIYGAAPPAGRRQLHRRLAELVPGIESRARHLALAAEGPGAEVAEALERAAHEANVRGAPTAAAELMDLCCRLTPAEGEEGIAARRLSLAEYRLSSGDTTGAAEIAENLISTGPAGAERALARELLARVLHVDGTPDRAAALCEAALEEVGDDLALQARVHTTLSLVSYDDFERAARHARVACDLCDSLEDADPALHSQALGAFAGAEHYLGHGVPMDVVERALALERLGPPPHVADRMSAALGAWLKYEDDFEGARRWLDDTYRAAVEEGDDGSLPYALSHLPQLELWTGNWQRAEDAAREHLLLAEQTDQSSQRMQALFNLALVHAHRGQVEETRSAVEEARSLAEAAADDWILTSLFFVAGFLELSLGDAVAAAGQFERHLAGLDNLGVAEPTRAAGDFTESLVALGELEQAASALAELERRATKASRTSVLATGARARALLQGAEGKHADALRSVDEARETQERLAMPFELARTFFVEGQLRRRANDRRAAADALERALTIFRRLDAPLWAELAEAELRRVPIRRGASDELTENEERVAELAAAGKTNREVAQELFISPKTVEANLSRVYRKLGIHSRAQLGRRMAERAS